MRTIAFAAIPLAFVLILSSCYITREGAAFLALQGKAESAEKLLADPALPERERSLLERAGRVRTFGIGTLGLKDTKNYTTLIEHDSERVATVVQACAELAFQRYLWSYPVVGKQPYKGFFDPADAEKEKQRLKAEGWDVIVRGVDSFSTLGWFKDPLYSFMADYGDAELAELLLHEMTHATAFSKSEGSFNEELATFVGRKGAEAYLLALDGPGSARAAEYRTQREEGARFAAFLAGTAAELEKVYAGAGTAAEKRAGKAQAIAERAAYYKGSVAPGFKAPGYRDFPMERMNNAYLDLYRLYEGESPLYEQYLDRVCAGDLKRFIGEAQRLAALKGDPKEALRRELEAAR